MRDALSSIFSLQWLLGFEKSCRYSKDVTSLLRSFKVSFGSIEFSIFLASGLPLFANTFNISSSEYVRVVLTVLYFCPQVDKKKYSVIAESFVEAY